MIASGLNSLNQLQVLNSALSNCSAGSQVVIPHVVITFIGSASKAHITYLVGAVVTNNVRGIVGKSGVGCVAGGKQNIRIGNGSLAVGSNYRIVSAIACGYIHSRVGNLDFNAGISSQQASGSLSSCSNKAAQAVRSCYRRIFNKDTTIDGEGMLHTAAVGAHGRHSGVLNVQVTGALLPEKITSAGTSHLQGTAAGNGDIAGIGNREDIVGTGNFVYTLQLDHHVIAAARTNSKERRGALVAS